jgi:hypothetical protein
MTLKYVARRRWSLNVLVLAGCKNVRLVTDELPQIGMSSCSSVPTAERSTGQEPAEPVLRA